MQGNFILHKLPSRFVQTKFLVIHASVSRVLFFSHYPRNFNIFGLFDTI